MKKTPWYPCSIKPVRNGWYEVSLVGVGVRSGYFSSGQWRYWVGASGDKIKSRLEYRPGYWIQDEWRGVTKP